MPDMSIVVGATGAMVTKLLTFLTHQATKTSADPSVEPVESVPQAHGRAVDSWHVLRCRSCMKDEGGPFEVGFQERASNHPKLRW